MTTGFYWDERCFWFGGGNYTFTMPVGGLVQPMTGIGLPDNPETKRRLKNLMDVTGLTSTLASQSADEASLAALARIHPMSYLKEFKTASDAGGGELGLRTPFGAGGYEQAALSAGLAQRAVADVMAGRVQNAYALSRPPGHHCLPDFPNGFCLLANIAIAVETARDKQPDLKVAIIDWDVHHGNGTEAIYLDRTDTLTISIHQERNYPMDTGEADKRGANNTNINVPVPPGSGHATFLRAFDSIARPALDKFQPDLIIVACGYDAAATDPLSRTLATAQTFADLTERTKQAAADLCDGRLVLVHEGGYSEAYVPFCGHATIATLAGSQIDAPDPMANTLSLRQPTDRFQTFLDEWVDELAAFFNA
ncbi:MAG: class II histone deacetylase [Planktomarina sp.]